MTVLHSLIFLAASSTSAKKTSSSSSYTFILFLVVIGVAGYFLLLRPQQQKARRAKEAQTDIGVGDEVLTVGGIVGTVLDINSERVTIITGADDPENTDHTPHRMVLVRNAIARKIEPPAQTVYDEVEPVEDEYEDEHEHDEEHDADEHDEQYPRYEYHPDEETAEENGQAPDNRGVKRNGRRRRKTGTNGSDKADSETGEETGT